MQPPWRVPAPSSRCHRKDKNGRTPSHSPKLSTAWFGSKANFLESGGIGVRFYTARTRKARATLSIVCDIFLRSLASCTWVARSVLGLPGSTGAASTSNLSIMRDRCPGPTRMIRIPSRIAVPWDSWDQNGPCTFVCALPNAKIQQMLAKRFRDVFNLYLKTLQTFEIATSLRFTFRCNIK